MFASFKPIVFALLLASVESKLRSTRQLSQEKIGSFTPITQVTDHAAIALDQEEIELHLGNLDFSSAREVYENGSHSKSFATLGLLTALGSFTPQGTAVTGTSVDGQPVKGKVYADAQQGAMQLQVQYETKDDQDSYVRCQVGGSSEAVTDGCFQASGTVQVNSKAVSYEYSPATGNSNGRTIKGFSTGTSKHTVNGEGTTFYKDFGKFKNYYGTADYSDKWVVAAITGTDAGFTLGNANFNGYPEEGRVEAVKKGTAYLSIFMYVIRELEDALDDCNRGCDRDECNDDAVHALDEAVAFYGGALLGDASSGNGNLLYALAEKRCENFNTCGVDGQSNVNNEIFVQFRKMQDNLLKEDCEAGRVNKDRIVELMYVPMIQGALRYAYFQGEQNDTSEKSEAEGATFAAAVLPIVHACSPVDADAIYDNMRIGETAKADFSVVKAAFENNYDCMGITCEDVGGLYDGADYYPKAAPCGSSKRSDAPVGVIVGIVVGVLAIIGLGLMIRSRSASQVEFKTDGSNPAV